MATNQPIKCDASVLEAGAQQLNNELTIVLSSVDRALQGDTVEESDLLELKRAAQRAVWATSALLSYASDCGARGGVSSVEFLCEAARLAVIK